MIEDVLLKIRFNRGDKDALCRIYEKYKDDLLKLAVALLNDKYLAEDVLNDTFVTFAKSAGKLHLRGNLKSFLATCVANHARNVYHRRERKKTSALEDAAHLETDSTPPEQAVIINEEYQRLANAMEDLAYDQRETMILHCCNDMKFSQIAKLQNISVNTAKSRYRYGLAKLRTKLNGEQKNEYK